MLVVNKKVCWHVKPLALLRTLDYFCYGQNQSPLLT